MSRRSRAYPDTGRLCALAVVLACTVMLGRVAVLVGAVSLPLLGTVAPWLALLAVPGLAFAVWSWRQLRHRHPPEAGTHEVRNPLSLRIAIQFALLYALVILAVRWANDTFGGAGLYAASFLSGLTDLDAIAISISQMQAAGTVASSEAARAVLLAAGANSALKAALALALGSAAMRRPIAVVLGGTLLLALASAWIL